MKKRDDHPGFIVAVKLYNPDDRYAPKERTAYLDTTYKSSIEEQLGGMLAYDVRAHAVQPWLAHIWPTREKAAYAADRARLYYYAAEVVELAWTDEWWTGVDHEGLVTAYQCDACWRAGAQECPHRGGARYCDECGEVRTAASFELGGDLVPHADRLRLRGNGPWRHWHRDYVGVCGYCMLARASDTVKETQLHAHERASFWGMP